MCLQKPWALSEIIIFFSIYDPAVIVTYSQRRPLSYAGGSVPLTYQEGINHIPITNIRLYLFPSLAMSLTFTSEEPVSSFLQKLTNIKKTVECSSRNCVSSQISFPSWRHVGRKTKSQGWNLETHKSTTPTYHRQSRGQAYNHLIGCAYMKLNIWICYGPFFYYFMFKASFLFFSKGGARKKEVVLRNKKILQFIRLGKFVTFHQKNNNCGQNTLWALAHYHTQIAVSCTKVKRVSLNRPLVVQNY